jgi:GAF domain-containing protein
VSAPAEPTLTELLEALLTAARRLTRAEAGTVYVRAGETLRFEIAQNEALTRRFGEQEARRRLTEERLSLAEPSFARYVALGHAVVNIPDVYHIAVGQPYVFNPHLDQKNHYRTRSLLAVPLRNAQGTVFGVLQLINARDGRGDVVAFDTATEERLVELVTRLAQAIPPDRLPS